MKSIMKSIILIMMVFITLNYSQTEGTLTIRPEDILCIMYIYNKTTIQYGPRDGLIFKSSYFAGIKETPEEIKELIKRAKK